MNTRNLDPGSHTLGSSPPSPLRFAPCIFMAIIFQLFLISWICVELCAYPRQALSATVVDPSTRMQINLNSHHGRIRAYANKPKLSPRPDTNSRTNTTISIDSSIRRSLILIDHWATGFFAIINNTYRVHRWSQNKYMKAYRKIKQIACGGHVVPSCARTYLHSCRCNRIPMHWQDMASRRSRGPYECMVTKRAVIHKTSFNIYF